MSEYPTREERIQASPSFKLTQELARIYVNEGHDACLLKLNEMIKKHKLVSWEASVLSSRVRDLLVNNGIILQRRSYATHH